MNARVSGILAVTSLALGALLVGGSVLEPTEDKPVQTAERTSVLEPSKLAMLPDGGKGYVVPVRVSDGGTELRTTAPDCVRRLPDAGAANCLRVLEDGKTLIDPGDWTRFPADASVGPACRTVACSVVLGESDREDEDAVLTRARDSKTQSK